MKIRFFILLPLALALPLAVNAFADSPDKGQDGRVRYHDDGLGVEFDHSAEFEAIPFAPPDNIQDALNAAMLPGDHSWPLVGLVEKRLARDLDLQALRYREVPAIVLERYPACPPSRETPCGLLEACMAGRPVRRIGNCAARDLIGYPGPYGWDALYWVVTLPASRRMLPPEKGLAPVAMTIPAGWLVIMAPRFFEPDEDAPADPAPRSTGYDREIRRILETLSFPGTPEEAPGTQASP